MYRGPTNMMLFSQFIPEIINAFNFLSSAKSGYNDMTSLANHVSLISQFSQYLIQAIFHNEQIEYR